MKGLVLLSVLVVVPQLSAAAKNYSLQLELEHGGVVRKVNVVGFDKGM
jgi:hypothetical protein